MAMRTFTRVYDSYNDAMQTVQALEASGVPHEDISIVGGGPEHRAGTAADPMGGTVAAPGMGATGTAVDPMTGSAVDPATSPTTVDPATATGAEAGAGSGATLGTLLGGGAGLLAGIGALAIPGVGPVVAAGWLIATLTGAGVGAAAGGVTGGLLGSLTGAGVPEEDAHVYAENVRRGGTLVTVRADESREAEIERVLGQRSAVDVGARRSEYQAGGWDRFDPSAASTTRASDVERSGGI